MNRESIIVGQYVHYAPGHEKKENGRVKSITEHGVFVVYNCAGEWDNYKDYTAANTNPRDLREGWVGKDGNLDPKYCNHEYLPTNAKWQPINQRECIHCGDIIDF